MPSNDLDLVVKEPIVRGPLALHPLFTVAPPSPHYLTGPEAERLGVLRVGEKPGGARVSELRIHNTGAWPLLLLEGETLVGAKQNRTLDASVLVPAGTAVDIPVSCVEAGRWGAPRASARSVRHAPSDLRRVKTTTIARPARRADKQSAVWDRVARYSRDLDAASPTRALEDLAEARAVEVATLIADTRPLPEQCGVAVSIDGTLRGFDCFDKPSTLAVYWGSLTAGYALDAVEAMRATRPVAGLGAVPGPSGRSVPPSPVTTAAVEALVAAAGAAARSRLPTRGLGESATLAGDGVVGTELRWETAIVHISAFVDETDGSSRPGGPVRPIRRRPPRTPR